jgi:hypothetical protein
LASRTSAAESISRGQEDIVKFMSTSWQDPWPTPLLQLGMNYCAGHVRLLASFAPR